jgi:hypothetical protein
VKGDEIRARQVANQIALRDAVAQYGVSKIFTFHSTVKSAESFVADGNEGVRTHLPEFASLHVSGAMPTARRERVMKEFRSAPKAVMSNARCLTEGVDVPAVDMVAFLSPKKSKVDIVQAIGRAMRKSASKEVGYVLIPLYLEQKAEESLEEAVARANFEEIWDILQSLQEQDDDLADLIRDMAVAKGSGKGFDDSRFSDRIAFTGPVLALESIRQAVTTKVLERLESSWDLNFGKLVAFKDEYGHCRVPSTFTPNPHLAQWVAHQRRYFSSGMLSKHRVTSLVSLGFDLDPFVADWESNFIKLHTFRIEHGHCRVPNRYEADRNLGQWVSNQRFQYLKSNLSQDRIIRLESIGFTWDVLSEDWDLNFNKLVSFYNAYGHCRVSERYKSDPRLGQWVSRQRKFYANGKLTQDRISSLEGICFEWDPYITDWELSFSKLESYKNEHGHCRVPKNFKKDLLLSQWVSSQRRSYLKGKLPLDRIARLESLGFEWDPFSSDWETSFSKLQSFKILNGHCYVPNNDPDLGRWVLYQRNSYFKGKLSADRITRLNELGIDWDPIASLWDKSFEKLERYYGEVGNCRVPINYKPDLQLGQWVSTQRRSYLSGKLSPDRIARLEALGFEWKVR